MIRHVLKDGTVLDDITGYVVNKKDAPMVYDLVERISRGRDNEGKNQKRNIKNHLSDCNDVVGYIN
jgi:hypothetical protein